jgi:hypothetical protein
MKKDFRKIQGFFNRFQLYIPHLAELNAWLTDELAKGKPNIEWTSDDDAAFEQLKTALCKSIKQIYAPQNGGNYLEYTATLLMRP